MKITQLKCEKPKSWISNENLPGMWLNIYASIQCVEIRPQTALKTGKKSVNRTIYSAQVLGWYKTVSRSVGPVLFWIQSIVLAPTGHKPSCTSIYSLTFLTSATVRSSSSETLWGWPEATSPIWPSRAESLASTSPGTATLTGTSCNIVCPPTTSGKKYRLLILTLCTGFQFTERLYNSKRSLYGCFSTIYSQLKIIRPFYLANTKGSNIFTVFQVLYRRIIIYISNNKEYSILKISASG